MKLVIPGEPVPKQRPRMNRKTGNVYTGRETIEYQSLVGWYAKASGKKFRAEPLNIACVFYCSSGNRDGDNLEKSVWDAIVKAGVVPDDKWFWEWSGSKHIDKENPRTEVTVTYATGSVCGSENDGA